MKRIFAWILALLLLGGIGIFLFYSFYLPGLVARAIADDEGREFFPYADAAIEKYREPANNIAEDVVVELHRANHDVRDLVAAVHEIEAEEVQIFLDELRSSELSTKEQVFEIAKKHFGAGFDMEILRKPFNENVDLPALRKALRDPDHRKNLPPIDAVLAKRIIGELLLEKERAYLNSVSQH